MIRGLGLAHACRRVRGTEVHRGACSRVGSTAAWLAGMAYLMRWLNWRFLVGVIIQAYVHGREGRDFLPRASLPSRLFFPLPHLLLLLGPPVVTDSPICFRASFTYGGLQELTFAAN